MIKFLSNRCSGRLRWKGKISSMNSLSRISNHIARPRSSTLLDWWRNELSAKFFSFVATNSIAHQHRRKCPSRYTLISFLHDGILRKLPENCGYSAIPLARFNIEMNKGSGWIRMKRQSRRGRSFSTIKTNLLLMPNSNFWNCSNALNFTFPKRNSCFWRGAGVYAWSGQYLCLVRTLFLSDFCAKIILGKFSW